MARENKRDRLNRLLLSRWLLFAAVFLLPWQSRWIFVSSPSEYWMMSVYLVELLIITAFFLGRHWLTASAYMSTSGKRSILCLDFFVLVLGALLVVSTFSLAYPLSLMQVFHVMVAGMLALMLSREQDRCLSVWAFIFGLIPVCVLGWFQVVAGTSPASTLFGLAAKDVATLGVSVVESGGARLLRAYGSFPHPNIFGGFLGAGVIFLSSAWLALDHKLCGRLTALSLLLGFFLATLAVTFSRSAWIGTLLGLIMTFIFYGQQYRRSKGDRFVCSRLMKLMLLLFISVAIPVALFFSSFTTRVAATQRLETVSLMERQSQYDQFPEVVRSHVLFGVGPGAYTRALAIESPKQSVWEYQPIHNVFLLVFSEIGTLGMSLFLLVLWRVRSLWSRRFLTALAFLLPIALFDHYLWTSFAGLTLMILCLLLLRTPTVGKESG